MLVTLESVEYMLPKLLADQAGWQSVYVDYHPPIVERLWRQVNEYRVALHRIHPCGPDEALFHPHPWPQAVRVLGGGEYEMDIGWGKGDDRPPVAMKVVVPNGFAYEMTDPDGWHSVRPIGAPSLSLMVTGKPWGRPSPKSDKPLRPLTDDERFLILANFLNFYPPAGPPPGVRGSYLRK